MTSNRPLLVYSISVGEYLKDAIVSAAMNNLSDSAILPWLLTHNLFPVAKYFLSTVEFSCNIKCVMLITFSVLLTVKPLV